MWTATDATGECIRHGMRRQVPYEEISCLYPAIGQTYTQWEFPTADSYKIWDFMDSNPWVPILAVTVYGISIFLGKRYMKNRPAYDLRKLMAAWNLFLALFSIMGFTRTAPQVLHNLVNYSWYDNMCTDGQSLVGTGTTAYWIMIFTMSKFFELFDTFFIIVHKKKLMFLHWYHHITVLLCCWHSIVSETPTGLIFAAVNFAVHGIMYFYYFLMATKMKPKWFNPQIITVAQISQMVVGVTVCLQAYQQVGKEGCWAHRQNIEGTLFMYSTYLYLFLEFFLERYGIVTKKVVKKE